MFAGKRPRNLGVREGRLAACPAKPNCVCSQDKGRRHAIEPIRFDGDPAKAMVRLKEVVSKQEGVSLVEEQPGYLYFECRSKLLGFVDDLEFYCTPQESVINVRSASRLGYSDLGVNRKRVERIRRLFSQT